MLFFLLCQYKQDFSLKQSKGQFWLLHKSRVLQETFEYFYVFKIE
ncbi:hypothetical protein ApDm4_1140 [Acetobacter pomorum]|nr:hypothetical protein ApDm4_1140 [Acetobacter pomorum]